MCGRYYRRSDKQSITEAFKVGKLPPGFKLPPDYNIAPSTFQPVIRTDRETGEREITMMRWGLVPDKIADPDSFKIFSTTNARSESILDKPIWRGPFRHTRCLVPLDGFYEWLQRPSLPQPPPIEPGEHGLFGEMTVVSKKASKPKAGSRPVYKFEMPDGAPYALAGLFSEWRPRKGSSHPALDTFSIVTTEANELTDPIHNRMPVILHPRDYERWLNDYDESRPPIDLLRPYESNGMRMTPANRLVGNVRNNGPEMLNSA
ncbi:SOS response-associated peptidase [Tunturiibacter empetritectus]|uniref:Abasic site processing protein n=1 Tax=Tunturiibacter lichenicola TaxID=2051959 RepID=A0A852VBS0_9BACT|nr:SOS response-associated peptidase [Edaphobacter lichenicola]NYF88897.1 putative SOS response-associated peptidase YedK [Edaphobacter lichenicola]